MNICGMSVLMQETLVSISSETTISSHIPTLCHQHNASALGYADSLNNLFVEKLDKNKKEQSCMEKSEGSLLENFE
ncbi:MAG: hypothetical protein MGU50_15085 [Trichodesmium sp. MAG_R02]|jgi:hypothetical protein|nr:hypothetical protein [Trichodesmium sp. MAG_R02]